MARRSDHGALGGRPVTDDDLRWLLAEGVELSRLRAFTVVAEEGSFTRAAEMLLVAQPWVSTQVRELESRAGVRLLDRSGTPVVPTEAGGRLLPVARVLLRRASTAADAVRRSGDEARPILRIGAPGHTWDVPARRRILERFVAEHPRYDLAVLDGESRQLVAAVRREELDAAFAILPLDADGLDVQVVDQSDVWVHVPVGHPLADRARLEPADLAGERLGMWDRRVNPPVHDLLYGPLHEAGAVLEPLPGIRVEGAREAATRRGLLTLDRASFAGRPRPLAGAVAVPLELDQSIVTALVARAGGHGTAGALAALWAIAREVRGRTR